MPSHSTLIDQLLRTVETIGYDNTDKLLKNAQFQEFQFSNKDVEVVVTNVAKEFNIPAYEIIYGNGRNNDRKLAIGFCAHYLKEIYKYDRDLIKDHIKTHVSLVSRYSSMIPKLNKQHRSDLKYLEIKNRLDKILVK